MNVTEPGPDPLAPAVMAIHVSLLDAAHPHPVPVVTVVLPDPPSTAIAWLDGEATYEQPVPDCVTVKVLSATFKVPVRLAAELFVATMKVTLPLPCPGPSLIIAIQASLLAASHAHPAGVVTVLLPEPPSEVNHRVVGTIEKLQALGAV